MPLAAWRGSLSPCAVTVRLPLLFCFCFSHARLSFFRLSLGISLSRMRTTLRSDSQRGVTRPLLVLRRISESAGRASGATRTSERIRCGNQEPGVEVLELLILNVARRAPTPTQLGATARSDPSRAVHVRAESCLPCYRGRLFIEEFIEALQLQFNNL